ncbi:MAG: tRNA (adenosine(37)-N6)-threonylcarbamoyltransferase complex transferase subunit TsaD [Candidatus Scalindua sp. AMX11]|nr:MAG: tRNA (adenosine(37)-N6)-threonylcarbamoyltransferase complex transferase subunit TsaD [Candidatus Scalindua sp.]NOG85137.1 tRNA (adenosine(37)-N6)-threonylcarbamoyltransferase complex transferase subunit TsaD [Planctomycetota bacterium]RZV67657.1 MAG: tRNA (adenosine(37)-N6)-threonylcarbamoyltransferase complex transferase subunit TsaD [Candidatus Scalindua sp. SCAELEC01]TDE63709.1 MAG: tRNA (adenosine(37)-N6)-threonylcarbamoyltransferase complex transferase subunit TsaD [Candidatus Scal
MLILGIETSCDETSAAVVEDGTNILSNIVVSQQTLHSRFGGVVPEIACREHTKAIISVVDTAIAEAKTSINEMDAISVANTPGLIGALLIGLTCAKTLSFTLQVPLITVNHLHAHIFASNLAHGPIGYPAISLVVSGGHTTLFLSESEVKHTPVGRTIDDAAGEAFDKVGKILGLGYPSGPVIDAIAKKGNRQAVTFPRSYLGKGSLDFSFSGIKTAVLYHCSGQDSKSGKRTLTLHDREIADVSASFQEAVVDVLVDKTIFAARKFSVNRILFGGGVAANSRLRVRLGEAARQHDIQLYSPPKNLCIDNAAMIAGLAFHKYLAKDFSTLDAAAIP